MRRPQLTVIITSTRALSGARQLRLTRTGIVIAALALVLLVLFGVAGSWRVQRCLRMMQRVADLTQQVEQRQCAQQLAPFHDAYQRYSGFIGVEGDAASVVSERLGRGGEQPYAALEPAIPDPVRQQPQPVRQHLSPWGQVCSLRQDYVLLRQSLQDISRQLRYRPTIMPVQSDAYWITSRFGWRRSPFTDRREFHSGLDISGRRGTPIIAPADGVVASVGYNRFLGHYVKVRHDERFLTIYGHLLKYTVAKRDTVKRGQVLGYMGTSGMSTGYHLHYEVHDRTAAVNPREFILDRKSS